MSAARLPAHLEVAALIRLTEAAGGFAAVIAKGDPDAGPVLVLTADRGRNAQLWERMPRLDGRRVFEVVRTADHISNDDLTAYLARRRDRDHETWLIELDIAEAERIVARVAS
jgi:hypothetical protein